MIAIGYLGVLLLIVGIVMTLAGIITLIIGLVHVDRSKIVKGLKFLLIAGISLVVSAFSCSAFFP